MDIFLYGIFNGLQLSLLAVGLTLIFGLGGILNLAHGEAAVITGIVTALLIRAGVPIPAAALVGILAAALFALVLDRGLLLPAYRFKGEARLLLGLMLTLGIHFALLGFLSYRYPLTFLVIRTPFPPIDLFGAKIRVGAIVAAALALVVILLLLFFLRRTSLGRAIRCIVQNEAGAELCGINVTQIRTLTFILGGLMAGFAGVSWGIFSAVGPAMGMELTVLALIVATVGGTRSINGTLAAGILLGVVNAFASYYIGAYLTYIILMTIAALTIVFRPHGILGFLT